MARSSLTGRNGVFFILITIVLALAPVPIGSNRPFFWMVNAVIIGAMGFIYFGMAARRPGDLRISLSEFYWPALLAAISLGWMVIQILPLPVEIFSPTIWTDAAKALDFSLWRRISLDTSATSMMIISYITYGLLFFIVAQFCASETRAHRFLQALFVIVTVHAGIGVILLFQLGDTLYFLPKWAYFGVATGFFVNRNSFATFLAIGLALGSALMVNAVLPRDKPVQNRPLRETFRLDRALISLGGYGACMAVIGSALLLTASRMSVPIGTIAILLPITLAALRSPARRSIGLALILGFVIIAVLIGLLSGGGLAERFNSSEAERDQRWPLYLQTLGMIAQRPISGFGGGTFEDAFAIYHKLPLSGDVTWDRAHNLYLELFADLGVFAFGVMAAVVFVLWKIARTLRRSTSVAPSAAITVAAVSLVHSLVDFSLQIQAIEFLFVAVLASGYSQAVQVLDQGQSPARYVARPRAAGPGEAGPFSRPARPQAGEGEVIPQLANEF